MSAADLPRLDEMITAIRRLENDTSRDAKTKLSGQAMLGLVLARLPGRPLETYTDRTTRKALADCELREKSLREFFGSLARPEGGADALAATKNDAAAGRCSALAFRPLVWDMTAMALRWEGKERDVSRRQGGERRSGAARVPRVGALRGHRLPGRRVARDRRRSPPAQALRRRGPARGPLARADDARVGVLRDMASHRAADRARLRPRASTPTRNVRRRWSSPSAPTEART